MSSHISAGLLGRQIHEAAVLAGHDGTSTPAAIPALPLNPLAQNSDRSRLDAI